MRCCPLYHSLSLSLSLIATNYISLFAKPEEKTVLVCLQESESESERERERERVIKLAAQDMKQKSTESSSKRKQACQVAPRFGKAARLSMHHPSPSTDIAIASSSSSSCCSSSNTSITSEEESGGIEECVTSSPFSDALASELKRRDESLQSPLLNMYKMSFPCVEKKKRCCNPWMRFCMLFPLLQRKLPSSSVASLQLVWNDFKAHKVTKEKLIASFRHIAGDQILIESIKVLQSLQARHKETCDSL